MVSTLDCQLHMVIAAATENSVKLFFCQSFVQLGWVMVLLVRMAPHDRSRRKVKSTKRMGMLMMLSGKPEKTRRLRVKLNAVAESGQGGAFGLKRLIGDKYLGTI